MFTISNRLIQLNMWHSLMRPEVFWLLCVHQCLNDGVVSWWKESVFARENLLFLSAVFHTAREIFGSFDKMILRSEKPSCSFKKCVESFCKNCNRFELIWTIIWRFCRIFIFQLFEVEGCLDLWPQFFQKSWLWLTCAVFAPSFFSEVIWPQTPSFCSFKNITSTCRRAAMGFGVCVLRFPERLLFSSRLFLWERKAIVLSVTSWWWWNINHLFWTPLQDHKWLWRRGIWLSGELETVGCITLNSMLLNLCVLVCVCMCFYVYVTDRLELQAEPVSMEQFGWLGHSSRQTAEATS